MRATQWTSAADNELNDEAVRLIPAIALARINEDQVGVAQLFKGYRERAAELGVSSNRMWQIMAVAGISWNVNHVMLKATLDDCPPAEAAREIIAKAIDWTVSDV